MTWKIVGEWKPDRWPSVGEEKAIPFDVATPFVAKVVKVVPGSHIEAIHDDCVFIGKPVMIEYDTGGRLECWDWTSRKPD